MELALSEARLALAAGEFPVGCVLVLDDQVIGRGHRRNSEGAGSNEIDHAEIACGTARCGLPPDHGLQHYGTLPDVLHHSATLRGSPLCLGL